MLTKDEIDHVYKTAYVKAYVYYIEEKQRQQQLLQQQQQEMYEEYVDASYGMILRTMDVDFIEREDATSSMMETMNSASVNHILTNFTIQSYRTIDAECMPPTLGKHGLSPERSLAQSVGICKRLSTMNL